MTTVLERVDHRYAAKKDLLKTANLPLSKLGTGRLKVIESQGDVYSLNTDEFDIYLVTSIQWRAFDEEFLVALPRLLAILETTRGFKGVPREIDINTDRSITIYVPTLMKLSDVSLKERKEKILAGLISTARETWQWFTETVNEVVNKFWILARKRGYNERIVEKVLNEEGGYRKRDLNGYLSITRDYYSIKFRIHTSESLLVVDEHY